MMFEYVHTHILASHMFFVQSSDYFFLLFVHQEDNLYFHWPAASLPLASSLALIKAVIVQTLFSH